MNQKKNNSNFAPSLISLNLNVHLIESFPPKSTFPSLTQNKRSATRKLSAIRKTSTGEEATKSGVTEGGSNPGRGNKTGPQVHWPRARVQTDGVQNKPRAKNTPERERARTIERLREDGEEFSEKGELLIARDREAEGERELLIVSKGKKGEFAEREERDLFFWFFWGRGFFIFGKLRSNRVKNEF